MTITKSDFLIYLDAPLHLWASKHDSLDKTTPSDYDLHLMSEGQKVEKYANQFLEEIILKQYAHGQIYFQPTYHDGDFEARADVLIFDEDTGVYDIYEIKSSTSVKKENLYDATFQLLVCEANIPVRNVFLVHLNKDYVLEDELDLEQLFVVENITTNCQQLKDEVLNSRQQALSMCLQENADGIEACYKPSACPCPQLCHPNLPADSIYDLSRLTWQKAQQLRELGVNTLHDIPEDFPLTFAQRMQIKAVKSGETFIDQASIAEELSNLEYPLYFLDYETYNSALPLHRGYKPQQQMVFQYSLHVVEQNSTEVQHREFIAQTKSDPAYELVKHLRNSISDRGSVIVWNKTFEAGRNKEMAELYPEFAPFLLGLNERIYDLADIFKQCLYVAPKFKGSWSIKNVLPVLVPDLSYKDLEIHKGDQAMINWWKMTHELSDFDEQKKIRENLLKYCELDTRAMVEIWKFLKKLS